MLSIKKEFKAGVMQKLRILLGRWLVLSLS